MLSAVGLALVLVPSVQAQSDTDVCLTFCKRNSKNCRRSAFDALHARREVCKRKPPIDERDCRKKADRLYQSARRRCKRTTRTCKQLCESGSSTFSETDTVIEPAELADVLVGWGPCPEPPDTCPADLTSDGTVDVEDLRARLESVTGAP